MWVRGVQSKGLEMPRATPWIYVPLPNCSIEEYEKYKHLKYVKTSVDKNKFLKIDSSLGAPRVKRHTITCI